ncbi:MAG: hypothetical protein II212_00585 [Alistipes sp.]|nr:hypothetical protein [Alistipes sp.]
MDIIDSNLDGLNLLFECSNTSRKSLDGCVDGFNLVVDAGVDGFNLGSNLITKLSIKSFNSGLDSSLVCSGNLGL